MPTLSVLLRLMPRALAQGEVVGHAVVIATGQETPIRSIADLVTFLSDVANPIPQTTEGDR